jgi:transcriptional regulator GlxA family with amidase domain
MSIKEFIVDIRLKRAAQLLKDSDLTVAEVSDRTGFANPKYFSVCFKRRWNLSPSEFKKQENPQ